jgi:hypothetical protein
VWNRHGKVITHASRDVEDEGSIWEIKLQNLKGSMVSDASSQDLNGSSGSDVEFN